MESLVLDLGMLPYLSCVVRCRLRSSVLKVSALSLSPLFVFKKNQSIKKGGLELCSYCVAVID